MSEEFRFLYKYRRGDACNYCGTVFGYDVESEIVGKSDVVEDAFCSALAQAASNAKEEALFRPCPRCGRLPSEAYATELALRWIWAVAFLPMLAGVGATFVAFEVLRFLQASDAAIERGALAAGAVATLGWAVALCYRCVVAHYVYFRTPAKNLKAPEGKSAVNRNVASGRNLGIKRLLSLGMKLPGASRREATFPELPKVLGTRPECATGRETKGRRLFWCASAIRIAAPWAFALIPLAYAGIRRELLDGDAVKNAAIALGILAFLTWAVVNWKIRYQGERHFGCGWDRASLRAELAKKLKGREGKTQGELEELRQVELNESARTVEVLRATTDLTPEGALFWQIAEEEAEELEALRQ